MATIQEDVDLVTLIVIFTVEPDAQSELVAMLQGVAADHSKTDGFVSCSILASEDGSRVAEYIQWRSHAHLQAMLESPEGSAHVNDATFISEVHSYRVASVTELATAAGNPAPAG